VSLWLEGFADLPLPTLEAAFQKAIKVCKFWPKIADIRENIATAEANASEEEAAERWDRVLAYAVRRSPDFPDRNPPRISERTQRAINAAGSLDRIRDCDADALVWCRREFIKSYIRYGELEQDKYLLPLPEGEIKDLFAEVAQKLLPPSKKDFESERYKLLKEQAKQLEARCGLSDNRKPAD